MPYLTYQEKNDQNPVQIIISLSEPFKIGRDEKNSLVLKNQKVSSFHAQIRFGEGRFWIEDLESEWGTSVNRTKIRTKILNDDDEILIGPEFQCKFKALKDDPKPSDLIDQNAASETVLEIDIDWRQYEQEIQSQQQMPHADIFPRLIQIDDGGQSVAKHKVNQALVSIGRSKDNLITLDHKSASRHHCQIEKKGVDYWLKDLGSANGTKVNSRTITEEKLKSGDKIQIGILEFRFIASELSASLGSDHPNESKPKRKSISEILPEESAIEKVSFFKSKALGYIIFVGILVLAMFLLWKFL
jgi:pSer/pThr/pTyr-binding forkhead associated (FHA) protein